MKLLDEHQIILGKLPAHDFDRTLEARRARSEQVFRPPDHQHGVAVADHDVAGIDRDAAAGDACGSCRACLDACPTAAFPAPYRIDARRCISYLTIEHRGAIPRALRPAIGDWVFGCDLCQEACPFNSKAVRAAELHPELDRESLEGAIGMSTWEELEREGDTEYRARVLGSALSRVKAEMFRRNLAIARKNAGRETGADPSAAGAPAAE